jgi:hypothetical protein
MVVPQAAIFKSEWQLGMKGEVGSLGYAFLKLSSCFEGIQCDTM